MSDIRIIKKYPNRRLYDTAESRYITLDDVKDLVIKHVKFQAVDANTNEDVTNYVLLQILMEQESNQSPILTTEILQNVIRFYGNPLQKTMSQFLENGLAFFTEHQKDFEQYLKNFTAKENPFAAVADLTQRNIAAWQAMVEPFFKTSSDKKSDK